MNKTPPAIVAILLFASICSQTLAETSDGIIRVKSQHSVVGTVAKLESALETKGMKVLDRVSHSDDAANIGLELRPTVLVVFGNPEVGSPLMQCQQLTALDLPQKALVYQDEDGQVWLAYNDPQYIASRHSVTGCDEVMNKISTALADFSKAATE